MAVRGASTMRVPAIGEPDRLRVGSEHHLSWVAAIHGCALGSDTSRPLTIAAAVRTRPG